MKITHLNFDKSSLEMGTLQEQVNNFYTMIRLIAAYLRASKSLHSLSLNSCFVSNEVMNAIGKGL